MDSMNWTIVDENGIHETSLDATDLQADVIADGTRQSSRQDNTKLNGTRICGIYKNTRHFNLLGRQC
jgi:hypothetical protein